MQDWAGGWGRSAPLAEFWAGGGNLPGLSCPEPSAFQTDKSQIKHTPPAQGMREGLHYPSKSADVCRRLHWGFLEKLEDLTNQKPTEEILISHLAFHNKYTPALPKSTATSSSWWGFGSFENCLKYLGYQLGFHTRF